MADAEPSTTPSTEKPSVIDISFAYRGNRKNLKRAVGVFLVLVIIVSICIAWWLAANNNTAGKNATLQQDTLKFEDTETQADEDAAASQYTKAAIMWENYAAQTPSSSHKKVALEDAGSMYMSEAAYAHAITEYKAASVINGLNYTDAYAIAQAAMLSGQKPEALNYLQQSLRLVPSNMTDANSQRQLIEQDITSLKQK